MSLPQIPSEGEAGRAYTHFHYCSTEPGKKWHAWVAGPSMWFFSHPSKRSKPCLKVLTSGKLDCPRCASDVVPQWLGYLPLYREVDARPVMIVLHEYTREQVEKLRLHERVIVGREDSQSDGVYVTPALTHNPVFQSTLKERLKDADLSETLLRVWNIPELTQWYRAVMGERASQDAIPVKSAGPRVRGDGKPFGPMMQAAAARVGCDVLGGDGTAPIDEALQVLAEKQKAYQRSTNGHHKKKSE